jgi:hypothetical protein
MGYVHLIPLIVHLSKSFDKEKTNQLPIQITAWRKMMMTTHDKVIENHT